MSTSITSILQQTEDPSYGSNACQRNKMHIDWKEKKKLFFFTDNITCT